MQETGVAGLQSPAYDLDHQHKYPEGGKMQVPSAPREQLQTKPVIEGAVHKSKFEYPLGDMDKPEIPKDLNGKSDWKKLFFLVYLPGFIYKNYILFNTNHNYYADTLP